jgi:hypothetical protein
VPDYVERNWFQNYAGRGRPDDFGLYAVSYPQAGFLFDQATRDSVSWFNYGEAIAGVVPPPFIADKDATPDILAGVAQRFQGSDLGPEAGGCFANDGWIGFDGFTGQEIFDSTPPTGAPAGSISRTDCFRSRFAQQLATGTVPDFSYITLTNDHTRGLEPGSPTPTAMIADNDLALGQIVDTISHSPIWGSSAIFVVEDDSQDGADHVDGHRTVAAVISPYAKAGAVVSSRYDQLSMIRSMELIRGMQPLGLADSLATPMYAAFTRTAHNSAPFDALPETVDLLARNPSTPATRALSRGMDFNHGPDHVSQRALDSVLWKSVHGVRSVPPPPGPNSTPERSADSGG